MTPRLAALALLSALLLPTAAAAQDAAAGATVFKKCAACHMVGADAKNKVGPALNGLFGRTAGSLPDYKYSPAMVAAGQAGLVWTDTCLSEYLKNVKGFVPKNKMQFAGLKKDDELANVIAFLKTHDTDGAPDPAACTYKPPAS